MPRGILRRSLIGAGSGAPVCSALPYPLLLCERQALVPECQIPALDHLRHDVRPVLDLEVEYARLTVFRLVERRQFGGIGLEIRELPVVPYRSDEERLFVLPRCVRKCQACRVLLLE